MGQCGKFCLGQTFLTHFYELLHNHNLDKQIIGPRAQNSDGLSADIFGLSHNHNMETGSFYPYKHFSDELQVDFFKLAKITKSANRFLI